MNKDGTTESRQQGPRTIRTLIVDDEVLARENLRIRLGEHPDFVIVGECSSGKEAIESILQMKPDLVFLDIQMPDLNGFDVIEAIPPDLVPVIVFVTAYDRYALEAFQVHALDYILKPFAAERFSETLGVCRQRLAEARHSTRGGSTGYQWAETGVDVSAGGSATARPRPEAERLVIKGGGRVLFLKLADVVFVEACGDYVRFHVGKQFYLVRKTMRSVEARLDASTFVRISRSAIVNLDHVEQLVPLQRGEYRVRLTNGLELKLTRTHRENLERLFEGKL